MLKLHINPEGWHFFVLRNMDQDFMSVKKTICETYHQICFHCGVQNSVLEIVNRDGLFDQNYLSNLIPVCALCTQCYFLESITAFQGGVLIYLPELKQEELNALCHVWFQRKNEDLKTYWLLRKRIDYVEQLLGAGMSNPIYFSKVALLYDISLDDQFFSHLRLLPFRQEELSHEI